MKKRLQLLPRLWWIVRTIATLFNSVVSSPALGRRWWAAHRPGRQHHARHQSRAQTVGIVGAPGVHRRHLDHRTAPRGEPVEARARGPCRDRPAIGIAAAGAIAAQQQVPALQGQHNTWYCGAWTGYGFHEDGLKSGLTVARQLAPRLQSPQRLAA